MDRTTIEARIVELGAERAAAGKRLDAARQSSRDALIAGKRPTSVGPIVEELEAIDAALAELRSRLGAAHDSEARAARTRLVERALELSRVRREKAAAVNSALSALHSAWRDYASAVQADVGQVAQAGGDTAPLRRAVSTGRQADALVKALVASSGLDLVRALGVDTSNRREHGVTLAAAEDRVLLSLDAELLRIRSTSPQRHLAAEAQRELAEVESRLEKDPLEL